MKVSSAEIPPKQRRFARLVGHFISVFVHYFILAQIFAQDIYVPIVLKANVAICVVFITHQMKFIKRLC